MPTVVLTPVKTSIPILKIQPQQKQQPQQVQNQQQFQQLQQDGTNRMKTLKFNTQFVRYVYYII